MDSKLILYFTLLVFCAGRHHIIVTSSQNPTGEDFCFSNRGQERIFGISRFDENNDTSASPSAKITIINVEGDISPVIPSSPANKRDRIYWKDFFKHLYWKDFLKRSSPENCVLAMTGGLDRPNRLVKSNLSEREKQVYFIGKYGNESKHDDMMTSTGTNVTESLHLNSTFYIGSKSWATVPDSHILSCENDYRFVKENSRNQTFNNHIFRGFILNLLAGRNIRNKAKLNPTPSKEAISPPMQISQRYWNNNATVINKLWNFKVDKLTTRSYENILQTDNEVLENDQDLLSDNIEFVSRRIPALHIANNTDFDPNMRTHNMVTYPLKLETLLLTKQTSPNSNTSGSFLNLMKGYTANPEVFEDKCQQFYVTIPANHSCFDTTRPSNLMNYHELETHRLTQEPDETDQYFNIKNMTPRYSFPWCYTNTTIFESHSSEDLRVDSGETLTSHIEILNALSSLNLNVCPISGNHTTKLKYDRSNHAVIKHRKISPKSDNAILGLSPFPHIQKEDNNCGCTVDHNIPSDAQKPSALVEFIIGPVTLIVYIFGFLIVVWSAYGLACLYKLYVEQKVEPVMGNPDMASSDLQDLIDHMKGDPSSVLGTLTSPSSPSPRSSYNSSFSASPRSSSPSLNHPGSHLHRSYSGPVSHQGTTPTTRASPLLRRTGGMGPVARPLPPSLLTQVLEELQRDSCLNDRIELYLADHVRSMVRYDPGLGMKLWPHLKHNTRRYVSATVADRKLMQYVEKKLHLRVVADHVFQSDLLSYVSQNIWHKLRIQHQRDMLSSSNMQSQLQQVEVTKADIMKHVIMKMSNFLRVDGGLEREILQHVDRSRHGRFH